jgi:phage terminase large subunit-like protein
MKAKIENLNIAQIGNQQPTRQIYKDFYKTNGTYASQLAKDYGYAPDEWQKYILNLIFAYNKNNKPEYERIAFTVPRQNGKNGILEMVELYWMLICGYKIFHTAHRADTAMESFQRLIKFFNNPKFPKTRENTIISASHGQESITYKPTGGKIMFRSRTHGGGLGFSVDKLIHRQYIRKGQCS